MEFVNMKLRYKLISAVILTMATTSSAFADEANAGEIHFTGELIEPSCVIEGDTGTDSTVPLGTYPTSATSATHLSRHPRVNRQHQLTGCQRDYRRG